MDYTTEAKKILTHYIDLLMSEARPQSYRPDTIAEIETAVDCIIQAAVEAATPIIVKAAVAEAVAATLAQLVTRLDDSSEAGGNDDWDRRGVVAGAVEEVVTDSDQCPDCGAWLDSGGECPNSKCEWIRNLPSENRGPQWANDEAAIREAAATSFS